MYPVLLASALRVLSNANADSTYTTHDFNGRPIATFTQVQGPVEFGTTWKDPSGMIWSKPLPGAFNNVAINPDSPYGAITDSLATEACDKIGGVLPTTLDYIKLANYFDMADGDADSWSAQGRMDFLALFPETAGKNFWTRTVAVTWGTGPQVPEAWNFRVSANDTAYFYYNWFAERTLEESVVCVYYRP